VSNHRNILAYYSVPENRNAKGVGGGRGGEASPDFKFMLLCVQAVTAKGHPKI